MSMIRNSTITILFLHLLGSNIALQGAEAAAPQALISHERIGSRNVAVVRPPLVREQKNNTCGPCAANALLKISSHLMNGLNFAQLAKELQVPLQSLPTDGRGMTGEQLRQYIQEVYDPPKAKKLIIIDTPVDQLVAQWNNPVTFQLMSQEQRNQLAYQISHLRSCYDKTPWGDDQPILLLIQAAQGQKLSRASTMSHWVGLAETKDTSYFVDTYDGAADQSEVIEIAELDETNRQALKKSITQQREVEKRKTKLTRQHTIESMQEIIQNPDKYSLYPLLVTPELHHLVTDSHITGQADQDLSMLQSILRQLAEGQINWIGNFEKTPVYDRIKALFSIHYLGAVPLPRQLGEVHTTIKDAQTMEEARTALQTHTFSITIQPVSSESDSPSASSIESRSQSPDLVSVPAEQRHAPNSWSSSEGNTKTPRAWWQRLLDWICGRKEKKPSTVDERIIEREHSESQQKEREKYIKEKGPRIALFTGFLAATLKILAGIFGSSS